MVWEWGFKNFLKFEKSLTNLKFQPPLCDSDLGRQADHSSNHTITNSTRPRRSAAANDSNWMLSTPLLTVFDVADDRGDHSTPPTTSSDLPERQGWTADPVKPGEKAWSVLESPPPELCVSVAAFGVLIASSTFLITLSAAVLVAMMLLRSQRFHHAFIHFAERNHRNSNAQNKH